MIKVNKKNINTTEYWENRFETNWLDYGGEKQSAYFMNLIVDNLPKEILNSNPSNICDVGMSLGAGTEILKNTFTKSDVFGIDFTENASKIAKKLHPDCKFKTGKLSEKVDIVVSSNNLEHTDDYIKEIKELLTYTNDKLIILVPYKENIYNVISEHVIVFDSYDDFPSEIDGFKMEFIKEINTQQDGFWDGSQLLVVYGKNIVVNDKNFNSNDKKKKVK